MGEVARGAPADTFGSLGERGFVARLRGRLPSRPDVALGAGDDCALVAPPGPGEELVLKADPLVEGRHFLPGADPRKIGRKALARVLSDFAAMGAEPRWALADFAAPPETPVSVADGVLAGFCGIAAERGVAVVGGDTSRGDALSLHVFCAGAVPRGAAMRRDAVRPGDLLFVTGALGGSFPSGRHFDFEPRLREGAWLRKRGVRAAIDVSDGLSTELWHLARASGVRIALRAESVPLSAAARLAPDPLAAALGDGEDFELLFSVPPSDASFARDFRAAFPDTPCTCVGEATAPEGSGAVVVVRPGFPVLPLRETGYDHFSTGISAGRRCALRSPTRRR